MKKIIFNNTYIIKNLISIVLIISQFQIAESTGIYTLAPAGFVESELLSQENPFTKITFSYLKGKELVRSIQNTSQLLSQNKFQNAQCERILEAGYAIFSFYMPYLNKKGLDVKKYFDERYYAYKKDDLQVTGAVFNTARFIDMINQIPTINNPHEELFVDVLQGVREEQLHILANAGYLNGFNLILIQGCPNKCLFCLFSDYKGINNLPFPLAIKIMRKIFPYQDDKFINFYLDSEVTAYRDKVIGATINHVMSAAQDIGYIKNCFVTHGVLGPQAENITEIMEDILVTQDISFAIYHADVFKYVSERVRGKFSVGSETDRNKRKIIIQRNVRRFVPLITGALQSGEEPKIRYITVQPETLDFLSPQACSIMTGMEELQKEIWEIVSEQVRAATGKDIASLRIDSSKRPHWIIWIGRAVTLLRALGTSEEDILKIQQFQKSTYTGPDLTIVDNDYMLSVLSDGSVGVCLKKGCMETSFMKVKEMFSSYNQEQFIDFLRVLKIILTVDYAGTDGYVKFQELDSDCQELLIYKIRRSRKEREDAERVISTMKDVRFFLVGNSHFSHRINYYSILLEFYLSREKLELLLADLNKTNIEKLFNMLKDVYFPTKVWFVGKMSPGIYAFNFAGTRPEKVLEDPFQMFTLPGIHAFKKPQEAICAVDMSM